MQDRFELILKTVKPEFSYTLDKLVGVTQRCINKSLEMLWASTQQKSVVPKIEASIKSVQVLPFCADTETGNCADICTALARKVRFKVCFWLCTYQVQRILAGYVNKFQTCQRWEIVRKLV